VAGGKEGSARGPGGTTPGRGREVKKGPKKNLKKKKRREFVNKTKDKCRNQKKKIEPNSGAASEKTRNFSNDRKPCRGKKTPTVGKKPGQKAFWAKKKGKKEER